jgi:hypothetical protein
VTSPVSKRSKTRLLRERLETIPPAGPGLPAKDSIRDVVVFQSPQGVERLILKTTETDTYDRPAAAKKRTRKGTKRLRRKGAR